MTVCALIAYAGDLDAFRDGKRPLGSSSRSNRPLLLADDKFPRYPEALRKLGAFFLPVVPDSGTLTDSAAEAALYIRIASR